MSVPNPQAGYEPDLVKRLGLIAVNWESVAPGTMREAIIDAKGEIERLQDAKRRALTIADERSRENVGLRAALKATLPALRAFYGESPYRAPLDDAERLLSDT